MAPAVPPCLVSDTEGAALVSVTLLRRTGGAAGVAGTSGTQDERHPPGDPYCQKCFVFAQLGATADLAPVPAVLVDGTFDLIGFAAPVASILPVRTPRNRGPPLPL